MQLEKQKALKFRRLALALLTSPIALSAAAPIVLEVERHQIAFDPTNGSILRVSETGATGALFRNDDRGLWELKFRDGSRLSATNFQAGSATHRFEWQREAGPNALRLARGVARVTRSRPRSRSSRHAVHEPDLVV